MGGPQITAPTPLPGMKDCDPVARLLCEGLCASPTYTPTLCPTGIPFLKHRSRFYLLSLNTCLPQVFQVTRSLAKLIWRILNQRQIYPRNHRLSMDNSPWTWQSIANHCKSVVPLSAVYEAEDRREDGIFLLSLYVRFQGRGRGTC